MKKLCLVICVCFTLFHCSPPGPKTIIKDSFKEYFHSINSEGTAVIYNLKKNSYTIYNEEQSKKGILPASTFKIYNALIGLETGVASDKNFVIKWDGIKYQYPQWNKDQTLESAIQNSVVWYFQELARRIGKARMEKYIKELSYGNMDISKGIDTFWLEGNLEISARQQIGLLVQLYNNTLPFSQSAQESVKDLIILEKEDNLILRGKTGTVTRLKDVYYSWFVGYLEKNNNVYFFAVNLEKNKSEYKGTNEAEDITMKILRDMKLL
ncbi:MAG: class D beta-lactamase [Spirochaetales bacterium]|nr:class D beta-lactamase [Spirochaetales bacterium]